MNRLELLKALKAVMPGVSKGNAVLQGADTFVLSPGLVQTYNDHMSASHPVNIDVSGVVRATEMVKVLERMVGLDITLTLDGQSLKVTDGRTTLSMRLMDAATIQLIQALDLEGLEWQSLPDGLIEAMGMCLPAASTNPAFGVLTGIRVGGMDVMASDNFRCAWAIIGSEAPTYIIPGPAVAVLARLEGLESYAVTPSWAHFMSGEGAIFSSRLLGGEFPADGIKALFPEDADESWELPEELRPALERVAVLASSQDGVMDYVSLRWEGPDLMVRGERQAGSVLDRVPCSENGFPPDIEIHISPRFLLDIMGVSRRFTMAGGLLVFGGGSFRYLTSTISVGKYL